jgi:acetyltransferase
VRTAGRTLLNEAEAKEVLAAYGVLVVPTVVCRSADEAVRAARKLGYPVVVESGVVAVEMGLCEAS